MGQDNEKTICKKRTAVCVGINEYDSDFVPNLSSCVNDAEGLGQMLMKKALDYSVVIVSDSSGDKALIPTLQNVRHQVQKACKEAQPGQLLLLFIACHGVLNDKGAQPDGEAYLIMKDTDLGKISTTAFSMSSLQKMVRESEARARILLLDSCHSGVAPPKSTGTRGIVLGDTEATGTRAVAPSVLAKDVLSNMSDRAWGYAQLASCTQTQEANEEMHVEGGHGLFTKYLLEALDGEADGGTGVVTLDSAYCYIANSVLKWSEKHPTRPFQTPTRQIEGFGDFLLADHRGDQWSLPKKVPKLDVAIESSQSADTVQQRSLEIVTFSLKTAKFLYEFSQQPKRCKIALKILRARVEACIPTLELFQNDLLARDKSECFLPAVQEAHQALEHAKHVCQRLKDAKKIVFNIMAGKFKIEVQEASDRLRDAVSMLQASVTFWNATLGDAGKSGEPATPCKEAADETPESEDDESEEEVEIEEGLSEGRKLWRKHFGKAKRVSIQEFSQLLVQSRGIGLPEGLLGLAPDSICEDMMDKLEDKLEEVGEKLAKRVIERTLSDDDKKDEPEELDEKDKDTLKKFAESKDAKDYLERVASATEALQQLRLKTSAYNKALAKWRAQRNAVRAKEDQMHKMDLTLTKTKLEKDTLVRQNNLAVNVLIDLEQLDCELTSLETAMKKHARRQTDRTQKNIDKAQKTIDKLCASLKAAGLSDPKQLKNEDDIEEAKDNEDDRRAALQEKINLKTAKIAKLTEAVKELPVKELSPLKEKLDTLSDDLCDAENEFENYFKEHMINQSESWRATLEVAQPQQDNAAPSNDETAQLLKELQSHIEEQFSALEEKIDDLSDDAEDSHAEMSKQLKSVGNKIQLLAKLEK